VPVVRNILPALAVALVLGPTPAAAKDEWLGRDKALHFSATFVLASAGYAGGAALSTEPVVRLGTGAMLAMGAGIAKEMSDRSGGDPSLKDLSWDAIGTATGLVTAWLVDHFLLARDRR
jgi:putative lipoprotein